MNDIESDVLVFSSLIKIHYDRRFIGVAQNFVDSLGKVAGANDIETGQLVLLIEECLVFIVNKYIDRRLGAHIEICFMLHSDNQITIEMSDTGPPIHESKIPEFNVEDEDSISGLWYKLVKELADNFSFVNLYSDGWLIRIQKNLTTPVFEINSDLEESSDKSVIQGKQVTRLATSEDVPQLIDLAYLTYRYSYPLDFYNGEVLKEHIDKKLYEITVSELDNRIVGIYIIKNPESGEKWSEIGSAMISPDYRSGRTGRHLYISLKNYIQDNPRDCDFYVSYIVTTHIKSQKIMNRMNSGFKSLFLFLNMLPRPDFIGIKNNDGGRESLIHSYYLNRDLDIKKVFITESNSEIISELISTLNNNIEVVHSFSDSTEPESQIISNADHFLGSGVVNIDAFGIDWFTDLNSKIISLLASGIESINVNISSRAPLPSDIESKLASLNLFFCGISLQSYKQISLAYCLTTKPVDFNNIVLYDPLANKLLEHIKDSSRVIHT